MTSYRIRLKERLSERWQAFFGTMTLHNIELGDRVQSELRGPLDQAGLHGMLQTIRDLNLHLLSVDIEEVDPGTL